MERRETLRGEAERVLDIIAGTWTFKGWAKMLKIPLQHAVAQGDKDLSQKLVRAGAEFGSSLHGAVRGGHAEIVDFLLESRASPDSKDANGLTALHFAAKLGKLEVTRLLLRYGADKDAFEKDRCTPLHLAAKNGHVALVEILLSAGANVALRSGESMSAIDLAAEKGHLEILKLLIYHGADVNATSPETGGTALHVATRSCKTGAMDVLLDAGANSDARDHHGITPLKIASWHLHLEAALCLLKRGADVNVRRSSGYTPLHFAASHAGMPGTADMVDLLLRWGADETIATRSGRTAADLIRRRLSNEVRPTDEAKRVEKLLANPPADRAWRRRALPVLCRAHPG
ncbi:unnamed protein product, partial [Hapterophycus canaliculatus]